MGILRRLASALLLTFGLGLAQSATAGFFDGNIAYEAGNYKEAFNEWRAASSQGDANSMNSLAKLYEEGKGTPRDSVLAYVYYDLAAILGSADATKNRQAIKARMNPADVAEASRLVEKVKETGQLPPEIRTATTSTTTQSATATTQESTATQTTNQSETSTQTATTTGTSSSQSTVEAVATGAPQIEFRLACEMRLAWKDTGSGGAQDIALYDPVVPPGFYVIGGYAQGNYNAPNGCVTVVRAENERLLAKPVKLKQVWVDRGSGANMDGSVWAPQAPSNDYICLGHVAQTGYSAPNVGNYRCLHSCLVAEGRPTNPVWTDERTGADKPVAIYQLSNSRTFFALGKRSRPDLLSDLNPNAACVTGG